MIKRIISLLTAIIMVFSASSVLATEVNLDTIGENLITNGNFKTSAGSWWGSIVYESSVSHDDLGGAGLVTGRKIFWDQAFWPNINLDENKTYLVSAWVKLKNEIDGVNPELSLLIDGATVIKSYTQKVTASTSEWKNLSVAVVKEPDKQLQVGFGCLTSTEIEFYIDDVFVKEIDTSKLSPVSIELKGATAVNVPQSGVNKVHLRGTVLNQLGTNVGMNNIEENLVWFLGSPATGVSIDSNGVLTVEPIASTGTVTVCAEDEDGTLTGTLDIKIRPALYKEEGNLFANGDFEKVGLGEWEGNVKILSEKAADGGFSAFVTDGEKCGQYIWLKPDKKYMLTAMVNPNNSENQFGLTVNNADVSVSGTTVTANNNNWHRISAVLDTAELADNAKVLVSVNGNSQSGYYADSFFLAEMREEFKECGVDISYIYGTEEKKNLINGELTVKAELANGVGDKNLIVAAALYKDKNAKILEDVSVQNVALSEFEEKPVELTKKLNVTDSSKQIVKVYVWNNNLAPVNEAEKLDVSDEIVLNVIKGEEDTEKNIYPTINSAISQINTIKDSGIYPKDGITVLIHEGVYQETLTFHGYDVVNNKIVYRDNWLREEWRSLDSKPVTFKAAEGEEVVISGEKFIEANFEEVTQEEKERIVDINARDHILKINLREQGIDLGEVYLPGSYQLKPFAKDFTYWYLNPTMPELIINGKVMQISRYPNKGQGHIRINSVVTGTDTEDEDKVVNYKEWENRQTGKTKEESLADDEAGFTIIPDPSDDRFKHWTEAENAIMYGYWEYSWADQAVPIKNIDIEKREIKSKYPSTYDVNENGYFYVYNLLEEIDSPGEYYIDRENGMLYFYPPNGVDINNAEISITQEKNPLMWFKPAHNIVFDGITFGNTRGFVAMFESWYGGVKNIVFKNCTFKNTGDSIARSYGKTYGIGFTNCEFKDLNGGISIQCGDTDNLTPGNGFVENCKFENYARITETYNSAIGIGGVGNRATHNTIKNAPHMAISISGANNIIEYNDISNVLQESGDMAAIYVGKTWISRGNKVRYNYIHDINSKISDTSIYGTNRVGVYGVYLDDLYSGMEITGNVFADFGHGGYAVVINGGRDNIVKNNAIINTYGSLFMTSIGIDRDPKGEEMAGFYAGLNEVETTYNTEEWYRHFPELYCIMDNEPQKPIDNIYSDNLIVNVSYENIDNESKEVLIRGNNLEYTKEQATSVGFANYQNKNYTLNTNSEVFNEIKGFYQLTPEMAGALED